MQRSNELHMQLLLCCVQVLLKDGGEKRELVVGVVRERHNLHESAGEVADTIGYQGCDGRILNSSEKGATGAVQIVEGDDCSCC